MKVCDISEYPLNLGDGVVRPADAGTVPPDGCGPARKGHRYLIEASAGTGKTYTITHLILRLVEDGVPVQKILVTTFSKAAADELKTRILKLLNQALNEQGPGGAHEPGTEQPDLFLDLDAQKRRILLQLAVSSIDEMTVSTIHGFCQKMLREYTLRSGNGFEAELVPDESEYRDRLVRAFCRNRFYGGSEAGNPGTFKTLQDAAGFASAQVDRDSADGEVLDARQTLNRDVYRYVRRNIQAAKDKDGVMSYDDIIRDFDAALQRDDGLAESIRARYLAVFVDEFQDTDRLQYRIFDKCFPKGCRNIFYMIGDPKQAIYGFRGADIYTYLQAKKTSDDQFTLVRNFRSSPAMIEAVNRMFSDGDLNAPHETGGVFLQKDIPFISIADHPSDDFPDNPGGSLRLRHYFGKKDECEPEIVDDVVREIKYLLSENCTMQVVEKPEDEDEDKKTVRYLRASDIAILVQEHEQAAKFVKRLNAKGIAASACKSGRIFDTSEAKLMRLLLRCFLHPDVKLIRGLMLSPFFRFSPDDLMSNSASLETLLKPMAEYGRIWAQSGLPAAFLQFLDTPVFHDGVSPRMRILSEFNGERAITNYIQLMELLYRKEADDHLLPEDLLNCLDLIAGGKMESGSTSESEDNPDQLRLDRDSASVQILTMFAAKGLEFPVVFVPFPAKKDWAHMHWNSIAYRVNTAAQDAETPEIVLDFGKSDGNKSIARQEEIRNNLRLLYVALTRASLATYLYTQQLPAQNGKATNYTNSAQGILMTSHRQSAGSDGKTVLEELWDSGYFFGTRDILPRELADWWKELDEPDAENDAAFRIRRNGVFERHFGKRSVTGRLRTEEPPKKMASAEFTGRVQDKWAIMSFSAFHNILANRTDEEKETPADLDEQNIALDDEAGFETPVTAGNAAASAGESNLFRAFPRGTTVGSMAHRLLEYLAGHFNLFSSGGKDDPADNAFVQGRIIDVFREFGYSENELLKKQLLDGIARTLRTPLPKRSDGSGAGVPLSGIRQNRMVPEMEFFLDAPDSLNLERILSILADTASGQAKPLVSREKQLPDRNGVLNGIIDLIFEHGGKYYIVDWKTNWLGDSDADYTPARIRAAMGNAGYVLQSYLYAAALCRFLRQRGMDYGSFGGVYYIFLRGLAEETENGIWFDVPPRECLDALLALFKKGNGV